MTGKLFSIPFLKIGLLAEVVCCICLLKPLLSFHWYTPSPDSAVSVPAFSYTPASAFNQNDNNELPFVCSTPPRASSG